jgi:hypothetical protein
MFYLGFAREMFKRHSLVFYVSAGNKILCHGQHCQQAVSSVGQIMWCEVMGWSMNSELEWLWKGVVVI